MESTGGVTYAGDRLGDGSWFVGFDCAHVGDGRDPSLVNLFGSWEEKRSFADFITTIMEGPMQGEHIWTEEEVAEECKRLAEIVASDSKADRYGLLEGVVANGAYLLPENRREEGI